jgi:putative tricarboxylic transport membrane protein
MRIHYSPDLISGLFFCAAGLAGIVLTSRLQLGSAARMGPGFFPMGLSLILAALGAITLVRGLIADQDGIGEVRWRPLVIVLAGVILFSFLVDSAGFVIAAAVLIITARMADGPFKPAEVALLTLVLIVVAAGIFVVGLKLPMRLLPV